MAYAIRHTFWTRTTSTWRTPPRRLVSKEEIDRGRKKKFSKSLHRRESNRESEDIVTDFAEFRAIDRGQRLRGG